MKKRQIAIKVSEETLKNLQTASQVEERPYAQIVREAIREKLEKILTAANQTADGKAR